MALNLPLDEKLAASINRRRIAEEQRKQRIFDSKVRQIGIDVPALNYQVHDTLQKRAREEELEKQYAEQVMKNDNLARLLEQQKANELKEENKKIDNYRLSIQRPEYRRDFDLYDPDLKKKDRPPRLSANDPCPVSNLQKLEGEDLNSKERTKKQKEQMRDLLLQQMQEKRLENYKKDKEIYEWEKSLLDQDRNALLLENREAEYYRKEIENLKKDNKILALQTVERNMQKKYQEELEKQKDIEFNFYSPLLSEDPSVAQSNLDPNRVVPDRWKGMSKEQLEQIHQEQLRQMAENQRRREKEQHEKAVWDQMVINEEKFATIMIDNERRHKYRLNKNLELRNQELTQEQKCHNEYINKVAFKNIVSDDYFLQFNKTSR